MSPVGGMMTLARTAPGLIDTWPDLRLWLIGDGELREELHGYFRHQGVRQNVAMPGAFVDLEDLFRVTQVMVFPSAADALDDTLGAAVAAAIPLVVVDSHDTRAYFGGAEDEIVWFEADDIGGLRGAIHRVLVDLAARRAAAVRLRRELLRRRPYAATVTRYIHLFDSLAAASRDRPSTGASLRS